MLTVSLLLLVLEEPFSVVVAKCGASNLSWIEISPALSLDFQNSASVQMSFKVFFHSTHFAMYSTH